MTYGQAKKDFIIFAVFVPVKNENGQTGWEEVEDVADDAEGRVGIAEYYEIAPLLGKFRLCFMLEEGKR